MIWFQLFMLTTIAPHSGPSFMSAMFPAIPNHWLEAATRGLVASASTIPPWSEVIKSVAGRCNQGRSFLADGECLPKRGTNAMICAMRSIIHNWSELEDVRQTVLREHGRVSLNVYDLPHELRMHSDLERV